MSIKFCTGLLVKVDHLVLEENPYLDRFIVNLLRIWAKCKVISRKTDDFGCGSVCRRWVSRWASNCELISMYYSSRPLKFMLPLHVYINFCIFRKNLTTFFQTALFVLHSDQFDLILEYSNGHDLCILKGNKIGYHFW